MASKKPLSTEEFLERSAGVIEDEGFKARYLEMRAKWEHERSLRLKAEAEPPKAERNSDEPRDILVVGDPHSDPKWDNERFTWLGRAIAELCSGERPLSVVIMGDMATLSSVGKFDRGKIYGEGQRLEDDIAANRDALEKIEAECAGCDAERYVTLGNHENRLWQYVVDRPELYGTISWEDLGFGDHGWEVSPFLSPLYIQGVRFQHYWQEGGRVTASKHLAANLLDKARCSIVVGHSHRLDHRQLPMSRHFGLSAGCFFEHSEEYATTDNERWWRGLVLLKGVRDGYHELGLEQIPMDEVRRRYA